LSATDEQRSQLLEAIDAWERLFDGSGRAGDLALVVAAATSQYAALWCTGTELINRLISIVPEAQVEYERVLATGRAPQRWHLITGLYNCPDRDFAREVLRRSLHDKAASVRERAAQKVWRLAFVELADVIWKREQIETNPSVCESLNHYHLLLTQGWYTEIINGEMQLVISVPYGICSRRVDPSELEGRSLAEIAHDRQVASLKGPAY